MAAPMKFPPATWAAMADRVRAGEAIRDVAAAYGVNHVWLRHHCDRCGVPKIRGRRMTQEQLERRDVALSLLGDGFTISEAAARSGASYQLVRKWGIRAGLFPAVRQRQYTATQRSQLVQMWREGMSAYGAAAALGVCKRTAQLWVRAERERLEAERFARRTQAVARQGVA